MKLHWIFNRYMRPDDGGEGSGGGAAVIDRGDDFTPTGPDAPKGAASEVQVTDDDLTKLPKAKAEAKAEAKAKSLRSEAPAPEDEVDVDPENPDGDPQGEGDEAKKGRKDTRIPLARHKEILAKERAQREALERQLAQTKQAETIAASNEKIAEAETKLLTLEREYAKLVSDGEHEKAAIKMAEIRTTERGINSARTSFEVSAAEARAYERVQYDNTVERLEAAYPVLNEDHDDFDAELMADVVELRDGFIATGKYTRAQALKKAAETLVGVKTAKQATAVKTEVRVTAEDVAKAKAEERAAAQREKNGKVAAAQPPNPKGVGADHDKMGGAVTPEAVMKMKHEDFVKLSEADLARLRGDEL